MILNFETRAEEVEYVRTHGLGANYTSYVRQTGKSSCKYREPIGLGEFLHVTGQIDTKPGKDIIGVCVIPELMLPDGKARFISMASMDPNNKETGNYTEESEIPWYYDVRDPSEPIYPAFMVQRNKIPLDNNSDGVIDGNSTEGNGYIPAFSSPLTIANPQDLGTKYSNESTNHRIPSPYAPDGSFNPNFHYRGSDVDEWALTDYRGDLNTRDVVYSEGPGEDYCPAFYCCEKFSPGYRNHEWYLPSIGELAFIPPRFEIIDNKMHEAIDAGSPGLALSNTPYWSSSEMTHDFAWNVRPDTGQVNGDAKDRNCYVRAFLTC